MSDKKYFSKLGFKYLIGVIVIFAVQILAAFVTGALGFGENTNCLFLAMMLSMYLIGAPVMAALIKKIPAEAIAEKKKMSFGQWFKAFIMCMAITYVGNIIGNIVTTIIGIIKGGKVSNVIGQVTGAVHPLVTLLIIVIMAPVVEEFLFRKLLIDRTAKYGEGLSIILSGLMFGLYHGNLNQFAYAFLIGCFLAFIYTRTKNVWYPVAIHMLLNFFGSFVSTLLMSASGYGEIMELAATNASEAEITAVVMKHLPGMIGMCAYSMFIFAALIFGIVLFIKHLKSMKLKQGDITIEKGSRFKTVILNWGMGLYCVFWLVQIVIQLFS